MNVTVHQRPGVYSAYDASSVVSGSGGGKQVGLVAVNTKATANEVKIVTSYDGAVNAFGQGTMAELIRLALKNGAGSVAAVPIASGEIAVSMMSTPASIALSVVMDARPAV